MAVRENEKIAKASQEWEYLRGDEAVKRMAFLREKWERDWNSNMHYAEETGMKKGMKKGMKEGRKEVAIKMLQEKIDEEIILKFIVSFVNSALFVKFCIYLRLLVLSYFFTFL